MIGELSARPKVAMVTPKEMDDRLQPNASWRGPRKSPLVYGGSV